MDWLLWGSGFFIFVFYVLHLTLPISDSHWFHFSHSVFELMNKMWWGLAFGIVAVGLLNHVPREVVMSLLGTKKGFGGLLRATGLGLLLDLCNHGILIVAMKLYERGATLGQTMAFLVASPWNSFSLTFILITLVGLKWTLLFIVGSMVIALISGWIFDFLVSRKFLPENPSSLEPVKTEGALVEVGRLIRQAKFSPSNIYTTLRDGLKESKMVLRWLLFGVLLASLIRTFLSESHFAEYFGPTLIGLWWTLVAATVIEVCSEGSAPIAGDLMVRANAPGNSFAFLMAGASTDYTEILAIRQTMKSWKIALFLPLTTLPQILLLAFLMNSFS